MNITLTKTESNSAAATSPNTVPNDSVALSDEELLLRYRKGRDRADFEQLVRRYERELYSYLRRYLGSAEMAEDAFQATFLQLHLKCKQFEEGRRVRPWLYAIATNQAIDAQRKQKRHCMLSLDRTGEHRALEGEARKFADLMASDEPSPLTRAAEAERNAFLKRGLDCLPEPLRAAIELVYFQGMKYREAADVMGIPVGTAKSRVHAAVAKLTEYWDLHHAGLD